MALIPDASYFARYDAISSEADKLSDVGSHHKAADDELTRAREEGKIARAQAKLDRANSEHETLQQREKTLVHEKVPRLEAEVDRLKALADRQGQLEKERDEMRRAAIDAHPSPALGNLQAQVVSLGELAMETSLCANQFKAVDGLCRKAQTHLKKALKLNAEAKAAEHEADAVTAAQQPLACAVAEPFEHAEERERARKAAAAELRTHTRTVQATIDETAAGADGLKTLVSLCTKAQASYTKAVRLTTEASEALHEAESTMRPPGSPALYGAAPPLTATRKCASEAASATEAAPAAEGAAATGAAPAAEGAAAKPASATEQDVDPAAERAASLAHLQREAATLRTTIKELTEGAEGLRLARGLYAKSRTHTERAMQLIRWAEESERDASATIERGGDESERRAAVDSMRGDAAQLKADLERRKAAVSTLNGVVEPCERAHGHYMRCMQLMRASEHQGSDEPLQKARAEGELGAAALSQAAGERWPPLVLERYQDRRDGFADLSRLPRSLDDVETVRGCVAIVAEKLGVVREVVAAHQHEVDGMAARLATLEAAFELETKRRSHLADALSEAAEAEAALGKAAAAIPAAVGKRYPEPSAPLFDERCETRLASADEEAKGGAAALDKAFVAVPSSLPARYPSSSQLRDVTPPAFAPLDGLRRVPTLQSCAALAAEKCALGKELEASVRRAHDSAKSELKLIGAALAAEEKRLTKLADALKEGDAGGRLLQASAEAIDSTPTVVAAQRHPALSAHLLHVHVPLPTEALPQQTVLDFFGDEASTHMPEWHTGDRLRQCAALVQRIEALAAIHHSTANQLEAALVRDHEAAERQLAEAKAAIPQEEDKTFAELRARAAKGRSLSAAPPGPVTS